MSFLLYVFYPKNEKCENQINECLNKINSRKNQDPCWICLYATKTDLLNDVDMLKLEQIIILKNINFIIKIQEKK